MTRAERKAQAAEKRKTWKLEWLGKIQAAVQRGVKYRLAVENLSHEVVKLQNERPQERDEIFRAWRELFDFLREEAKKVQADAKD